MEIGKETAHDLWHGHAIIGIARTQIVQLKLGAQALKGILFVTPGSDAPVPNTHSIWVGGTGVTADSNPGSGGVPLLPGDSLFVPIADVSKLYAVSIAANQDLAWMVM